MIVLNECRIDQEGKNLIIEATVDNLSYYKNVYIDSVIVDTDSTYCANGPSNNPVYKQSFESSQSIIVTGCECSQATVDPDSLCGGLYSDEKTGAKHIKLVLSTRDLNVANLNENIFFVYIFATGYPDPGTPCGMDNSYIMGVAVNLRPIYNMAMGYIKELNSNCSVPKGFIDMFLRLKAFDLSLKTGNYNTAIQYWTKLFKNKVSVSSKRRCGCNGIN